MDITNIWPNPVKDILNIMLDQQTETVELSISDMQGRIVSKQTFENPQYVMTFDMSGLPSGMYMIKLSDAHRSSSRKIIHQ